MGILRWITDLTDLPLGVWWTSLAMTGLGILYALLPEADQCAEVYYSINLETQSIMEIVCFILK